MLLSDYLSDNWGILILLTALGILLRSDIHLERKMVRQIGLTCSLIFLYSVSCYIEAYLGKLETYTVLRPILSAVDYSLATLIFVSAAMIIYPGRRRALFLPWAAETVLCFISIPTGIIFLIGKDNSFARGPLGFLPFVIDGMYLLLLLFCIFQYRRWEKNEYIILGFMFFTAASCLFMPLYFDSQADQWLMLTIAVDILVYYVFLLQQFTIRDPLTDLLNRQCYYADLEKLEESLTALIAIDMNGLKEINDTKGHAAGDKALKDIARCFEKAVDRRYHIYRIGGDEFSILCTGADEKKVKLLIQRIELELAENDYTCSIGYAMNSKDVSLDELYRQADAMLYENKRAFYLASGKNRRKH
ncbi:MAG: GGDEF domain-containing protein [Ruminococcus sp.]|nr:GGDEF domain-containing protein [Ruminococcus sp.]